MRFVPSVAIFFTVLSSVYCAAALQCAEASRFGDLAVSPATLAIGDTFTVTLNLTCGIQQFGLIPAFLDYYISVPVNNNGHEPNILLARHTFNAGGPAIDTFTATLPNTKYFAGSNYVVLADNINSSPGSSVLTVGGIEAPITITGI